MGDGEQLTEQVSVQVIVRLDDAQVYAIRRSEARVDRRAVTAVFLGDDADIGQRRVAFGALGVALGNCETAVGGSVVYDDQLQRTAEAAADGAQALVKVTFDVVDRYCDRDEVSTYCMKFTYASAFCA